MIWFHRVLVRICQLWGNVEPGLIKPVGRIRQRAGRWPTRAKPQTPNAKQSSWEARATARDTPHTQTHREIQTRFGFGARPLTPHAKCQAGGADRGGWRATRPSTRRTFSTMPLALSAARLSLSRSRTHKLSRPRTLSLSLSLFEHRLRRRRRPGDFQPPAPSKNVNHS